MDRYHLVNPLAYDIARAMGNITPETRPVRFYLNGTFQGVYVVTEHFDVRDFFEPHNGRRAYMNYDQLDRLWNEVQSLTPLRMRTIGPLVDIDNLTRWFMAMEFCGTRDAYQGPGQFYQPERTPAPWFWVTWDMVSCCRSPGGRRSASPTTSRRLRCSGPSHSPARAGD